MCWVFTHNLVESNNNPNVPISGTAGLGPTGTGMTISGGRFDTVSSNRFLDNGAWGMAFLPYPDGNTTSDGRTCTGTKGTVATSLAISGLACVYDPWGGVLSNNKFSGNGSSGGPSNADFANLLVSGGQPVNCFPGNTRWTPTSLNGRDRPRVPMPRTDFPNRPRRPAGPAPQDQLPAPQHRHDPADPGGV